MEWPLPLLEKVNIPFLSSLSRWERGYFEFGIALPPPPRESIHLKDRAGMKG
jgi:hypothetical protein